MIHVLKLNVLKSVFLLNYYDLLFIKIIFNSVLILVLVIL